MDLALPTAATAPATDTKPHSRLTILLLGLSTLGWVLMLTSVFLTGGAWSIGLLSLYVVALLLLMLFGGDDTLPLSLGLYVASGIATLPTLLYDVTHRL